MKKKKNPFLVGVLTNGGRSDFVGSATNPASRAFVTKKNKVGATLIIRHSVAEFNGETSLWPVFPFSFNFYEKSRGGFAEGAEYYFEIFAFALI